MPLKQQSLRDVSPTYKAIKEPVQYKNFIVPEDVKEQYKNLHARKIKYLILKPNHDFTSIEIEHIGEKVSDWETFKN